jgi:two-component system, cell cycle sensor histidine kinase and response regulator CckA
MAASTWSTEGSIRSGLSGSGSARGGVPPEERLRQLEEENRALRSACDELARVRDREWELFEFAPIAYVVLDVSGCVLAANRMLAELAGERQDALIGGSLVHLICEADGALLSVHLAEVLASGQHQRCTLRLRRPDGPPVPVWVESLLAPGTAQDPPRIWSTMSGRTGDVGATGRCESRLDALVLEQLACEVDEGLYHRDAEGKVTLVNDRCAVIWGQPPEALLGGGLARAIREVGVDPRAPKLRAHRGATRQYRVARPDGELRVVRERTLPVRDRAGGSIALVHDVTADREREELGLQQRRMETLGMFASGIAHDFANVVMGIQGCARQAREAASPETAEMLADIERAADHGGRLVRRLLVFARKQRVERSPLAADSSIARAVELVRRLLGQATQIELDLCAPGAVVMTDQVELDQIVMNLATNARDAMADGGVIRVSTEPVELDPAQARQLGTAPGRFVRLVVADSGVGMDAPTQKRVFERYFTTKPPGHGTGLGLTTVRAIAAELEGGVGVESERGSGTIVSVFLPTIDL